MSAGERSFKESRAPWRGELRGEILQGEGSFVGSFFVERSAP